MADTRPQGPTETLLARLDQFLLASAAARDRRERVAEVLYPGATAAQLDRYLQVSCPTLEDGDGITARLLAVVDAFGLSTAEREALVLALAPDLDRRYERAVAALAGDRERHRPTVDTGVSVLRAAGVSTATALRVFAPTATLTAEGLLDLHERTASTPLRARTVAVQRRPLSYLLGADTPDSAEALQATGGALDELADSIEPSAAWDDIVLPPETTARLRAVVSRVRNRQQVYEAWDVGTSRGSGVVALFAGPSGTGKTMAAEVVARETDRTLRKVDLSTVVSKYVGETESKLQSLFAAAERSESVLLFDEADAVFGSRSAVSDATDRYANVEVNYLLQRVERYDGVVLLTSNNPGDLDDAFQRRLDLRVDFERPERDARERLWRGQLDGVPTGDVEYETLAGPALTGGAIANAAETAAFLAAEADEPVGMAQLVPAVAREVRKTGQLLDPESFGCYRSLLPD